jgi:hypothetical protein
MKVDNWRGLLKPEQLEQLERLEKADFSVDVRRYVDPEGERPSTYLVDIMRTDHSQFATEVEGLEKEEVSDLFNRAFQDAAKYQPELLQ